MKNINREIEVVENIIQLLNKCLVIAQSGRRQKEIASCKNDIRLCKKELNKLLKEREAERVPLEDARLQRSNDCI